MCNANKLDTGKHCSMLQPLESSCWYRSTLCSFIWCQSVKVSRFCFIGLEDLWVSIFFNGCQLPYRFFPKLFYRIFLMLSRLWYILISSSVHLEKNKAVDNSNINDVEEQTLPPSHTFPKGCTHSSYVI